MVCKICGETRWCDCETQIRRMTDEMVQRVWRMREIVADLDGQKLMAYEPKRKVV